jgi:hypothetical protein
MKPLHGGNILCGVHMSSSMPEATVPRNVTHQTLAPKYMLCVQ